MTNPVSGFYKKTKEEKIAWLEENYFQNHPEAASILKKYWNSDVALQQLHDEFIENTVTNLYLPFGVAPNFLINGKLLTIPMAIEESSVVAAASNSAKFWLKRGGFKAEVLSSTKNGQVHFNFSGDAQKLEAYFQEIKPKLLEAIAPIATNMKKRGGGVQDIVLVNKTSVLKDYYQLHCTFETLDAMGANFINSCLEQFAKTFVEESFSYKSLEPEKYPVEIVMSILSNYVPECMVRAEVSCKVEDLANQGMSGKEFGEKFVRAIAIANAEPRRAVTHNKGIMNGIDAVILATGNDFRAVEAGIHAFASSSGSYKSLTHAKIEAGIFSYWIEIPLAVGTIGGLTSLHPLVKVAFSLLQQPNAKQLMEVVAVAGLAQNFAAVRSLITTGIQKGHMKMHLMNILNQLSANEAEKQKATAFFEKHPVTHSGVVHYINDLRKESAS